MHSSQTSDSLKSKLKNDLNNLWKTDLLMYSPTIGAGVNFDEDHFDYLFVILSRMSCNPRDTIQMMNRVRRFTNNKVVVYVNGLKNTADCKFMTFEDTFNKVMQEIKEHTQDKPNHHVYHTLYAHNMCEKHNSEQHRFVPYIIKLFKSKGHRVDIDNLEVTKKAEDEAIYNVKNKNIILQAKKINNTELEDLLRKQTRIELFDMEKAQIKRHYAIKDILNTDLVNNDESFNKDYSALCNILADYLDPHHFFPNHLDGQKEIDKIKGKMRDIVNNENELIQMYFCKIPHFKKLKLLLKYILRQEIKTDSGKCITDEIFLKDIDDTTITNHEKAVLIDKLKCIEELLSALQIDVKQYHQEKKKILLSFQIIGLILY